MRGMTIAGVVWLAACGGDDASSGTSTGSSSSSSASSSTSSTAESTTAGPAQTTAATLDASSTSSSTTAADVTTAAAGTSSSGGDGSSTATSEGTADASSSGSETGTAFPECPTFAAGEALGTITDGEIVETSGVAASRTHADVLWVHNDSGDSARAFAIASDGLLLGELGIDGALPFDWEDMALGPGPDAGVDYLYFGDIGDNLVFRPFITVYRLAEPDPTTLPDSLSATALNFHYPDGAHDAETLLSDPSTGDLYIVSKVGSGMSSVYRAAFPQAGLDDELELVASLVFGADPLPGSPLVTGGDIAPDGSLVVLRTYSSVFGWRRTPEMTVAEALATDPCPLPAADKADSEAVAVGAAGYYTIAEGSMVPVWYFAAQ